MAIEQKETERKDWTWCRHQFFEFIQNLELVLLAMVNELKTNQIINKFWLLHSQTPELRSHYLFCTIKIKENEGFRKPSFLKAARRQCSWKVQLVWGDLITETKFNLKLTPWLSNCNIQNQHKLHTVILEYFNIKE